ncbi:tol-pal system protein YbgF [Roseibium hamelinense]|uniref:Cell division coordinator CpoB n=1 Tax=Roseibium hamelinense TaxID=150831 RepID=A0A562SNH5_9HYPH|nr:tol-pal system protein YbgF [Roseibium hamelinense]MTI44959.1 tol-pal system protein YbgF [Roseibium hamelinense]TWI82220.1 tol-pal system protein YbgF [Roseibium hamelinense]
MIKFKVLATVLSAIVLVSAVTPSQAQLFGRRNDEASVRLNEMEERLRLLTGQIEQLSFQLREMQEQMRRMQEDNEYRFQQLEGGAAVPRDRSDAGGASSSTGGDQQLAASSETLGTLSASGSGDGDWSASGGYEQSGGNGGAGGEPIDLSALAGGLDAASGGQSGPDSSSEDQIGGLIATGDPTSDYDRAYSLAVNGQYAEAETAFRNFVDTYPDHRLSANAQYWLGESLLAQRDYREAADAFLKTYTEHPGNDKSPDSLLKLGVSLTNLGERGAACATFAELLTKFPGAAPAVLSQAQDERQRAQCA